MKLKDLYKIMAWTSWRYLKGFAWVFGVKIWWLGYIWSDGYGFLNIYLGLFVGKFTFFFAPGGGVKW